MSKSLSTNIFIKIKSLRESLDSHISLDNNNKKFTIDLISSILKKENIDDDKYFLFLLYTNKKTNTGRFCLEFNDFLDNVIQQKDTKMITNLIIDFKEGTFFELYGNKLLDDIEKESIKQILNHEFTVLKNTIEYCIKNEFISIEIFNGEIYMQMYKQFCESNNLNYIYTGIPKKIYIKQVENGMNKLYIFNFMELIFAITEKNINPINSYEAEAKKEFDNETYIQLTNKYAKEIKMIKRFFKTKNKT